VNESLRRPLPIIPAPIIIGVVLLASIGAGRLIATGHVGLSVGIVLAIPFFVLVFMDLAMAIAIWVGMLFIAHLSALSVAPTAIEILLALAWLAAGGNVRGRLPVLQENPRIIGAIAAFLVWVTISAAWSFSPSNAGSQIGTWWQSAVMFLIVATTLTTVRDVRAVTFAFVIGACISVLIGLLGFGGPTNNAVRIAAVGNRLTGGGGDPNYQASAFLAAMFIAGGLVSVVQSRRAKLLMGFALAFITVGFIATESRGGLIALGVAAVAAFVLLPDQRRQVLSALGIGALGLGVWVMIKPNALARITDFSGGTSGRSDQWTIAWKIFKQHPLIGVGINNFRQYEPRYVLQPGTTLNHVHLVAETPEIVHNAFLQFLAETGVVGLVLFLLIVFGCLRATWQAIQRFDDLGDRAYASLSRAVLIGTIGMLAAMIFISDADDFRLWTLFALGPVLLTLSKRHRPAARAPVAARRAPGPRKELAARPEPPDSLPPGPALRPDERALLALIIVHHKSFAEIARLLRIEPSFVRSRAHAAITALGQRVSGRLLHSSRVEISDYLLGEQPAERGFSTRALLESSPAAREWAHVVQVELRALEREEQERIPVA
jgi:putative inorganic carbon (HCO3(-)) transporter